MCFMCIWVFGRGEGARAQPAYAIFLSRQLNKANFKTDFSDILTNHIDQISHVKHVLDSLYAFFT